MKPFHSPAGRTPTALRRRHLLVVASAAILAATAACGSTTPTPIPTVQVGSIVINSASFNLERGYHASITATVKDKLGAVVAVPVAWRSSNEAVATIDANGRIFGVDTGTTTISASSLGVSSANNIGVHVVFIGPAKIATFQFTQPNAVTPSAVFDSLRVQVTNILGQNVGGARVSFAVTAGGGTVSPAIATSGNNGVAAAEWILGATPGVNTVVATMLGEDDKPALVTPNTVTFSVTSFAPLAAVAGDGQSGLILSVLPVQPAVRVVDASGNPRPGVPVTFAPTGGGRVATSTVSTGANGVASPGNWTLGDIPGQQTLVTTVEAATIVLHATATGTPIYFTPPQIIAGGLATCAINADASASCFGQEPQVGDSSNVNKFSPTPVKSSAHFTSIVGSMANPSHFCGVATDQSILCWGINALADTTGRVTATSVPSKLASAQAWTQAAPGGAHNCALATDKNVYCWGDNTFGQLGDRTTTRHFAAAPVFGGFLFQSVTSGANHSCGLTLDGSVFCWGLNQNGQLGDGTQSSRSSPTVVTGAVVFQSVSAGETFTCGITTAGRAMCWGNLGNFGTVVTSPRGYPTTLPLFTSISVGGAHACALAADGTAYCWGNNSGAQLGDSTTVDRQNPTAVVTPFKFKSISAGYTHTCGLVTDGSVACWGLNRAGELGDSTSGIRLTPRRLVLGVTP